MVVPERCFKIPIWISQEVSEASVSRLRPNPSSVSPGRPTIRSTCICAWVSFSKKERFDLVESEGPVDVLGDLGIECLDTDFKLQGTGGEAGNPRFQRIGKVVGDHLEMDKVGRLLRQEKVQDGIGELHIEIEGAVDELEVARPALPELFKLSQKGVELEVADLLVDGREAELAQERAAAGGFDVDVAVGDIAVTVVVVWEADLFEVGHDRGNELLFRGTAVKDLTAEPVEGDIAFALDDIVGF